RRPGRLERPLEQILRLLLGVPFAPLELEHQTPQQRVQLLLLALVEGRPYQVLVSGLHLVGLHPLLLSGVGQLDEHAAPVVRIGEPSYEPGLLEPVEPVRHRAAGQLGPLCERSSRTPERRPRLAEGAEDVPLFVRQAVLRDDRVQTAPDAPAEAAHAVDDPLDLEIQERDVLEPGVFQPPVDVVALFSFLHAHSLHSITLDVKTLWCYRFLVVRPQDTLPRREATVYPVDVKTQNLVSREHAERLRDQAQPPRDVGLKRDRRAHDPATRALLARAFRPARI